MAQTPKPKKSDEVKKRARIGLAIVMETHTLAFVSNDLLFEVRASNIHICTAADILIQPIWERSKAALPRVYLGVYDQDYEDYLRVVVGWLQERQSESERWTRKAWDAIKSTQDVFMGVGVYTACELLFDAGEQHSIAR